MRTTLSLLLFWCVSLPAQTTVYLRDNPAGSQITSCDTGTPIACTLVDVSRFTAGDLVIVGGVCATNSGAYNISSANGGRTIGTINVPAKTVSLLDRSNNPVAANGPWCSGASSGATPGNAFIGKVSPYTLNVGIKGYFDGDSGPLTRQWALNTANGLASTNGVVVTGCPSSCVVAINVTYTLAPAINTGDHFSLWNTTGTNLNRDGVNSDFVVASSTTTSFISQTFTATGLTNGDYTHNDHGGPGSPINGTIQGTDNVVRVSQKAVLTNYAWTRLYNATNSALMPIPKFLVDGGNQHSQSSPSSLWTDNAVVFLLDCANHSQGTSGNLYLDAVEYGLNNYEKLGGATFIVNEAAADGGNYPLSGYGNDVDASDMAVVWGVGQAYLTATQKTTFIGKMINDIADPVPCAKTLATPHDVLASGVAGSTQNDATHITLAAEDSAATGHYVNNIVAAMVSGQESDAVITANSNSSKVVTVTGWSAGTPTSGTAYTIYSTVTIDTTVSGASSTITGYNTNFAADVAAGDMLYGVDPPYWYYPTDPGSMGPWVTSSSVISAISGNSQTINHLLNSSGVSISSTPQVYWRAPKWTPGSCGRLWLNKYWSGAAGSQPASYPVRGGYAVGPVPVGDGGSTPGIPNITSNNSLSSQGAFMDMMLALAEYDSRAITNLSILQTVNFDYDLSWQWNYQTGYTSSGANYGVGITSIYSHANAWNIAHSVSGFPDVGLHGPFTEGRSLWNMFAVLPDNPFIGGNYNQRLHQVMMFGGFGSNQTGESSVDYTAQSYLLDHGMAANPTAPSSQFLKGFFIALGYNTAGKYPSTYLDQLSVKIDPRIVPTDYTTQPLQYVFGDSASSVCAALTWWSCNTSLRAGAILSRTSWTDQTGTLVQFQARGLGGDHDSQQPGTLQVWKAGPLMSSDWYGAVGDSGTGNSTDTDSTPEFTGVNTLCPRGNGGGGLGYAGCGSGDIAGAMLAGISRVSTANHGLWPANYMDQNSRYVYAMADLSKAYTTPYNHVFRHFAHFKKPGAEEIIIQYDDIDASNAPTQIAVHGHYPQNGQKLSDNTNNFVFVYDKGSTSCPGSGGCASLNLNRTILEQQTGLAQSNGNPTPQYNLITKVVVPGGAPNVFVRYDTPVLTISSVTAGSQTTFAAPSHGLTSGSSVTITGNTGAWAVMNYPQTVTVTDSGHFTVPVDSSTFSGSFNGTVAAVYPGGYGFTNRVSFCADASSSGGCGAGGQNEMELIQIHKIATQPDTALTTTALNPDANWTGVQTTDKVALFARHGLTYSTLAGFTTTHAGTAQYLFAGFTPGTYTIAINGTPVTGSPFTVSANDNTIPAFESTSGVVSINGSVSGGSTTAAAMTSAGSLSSGARH